MDEQHESNPGRAIFTLILLVVVASVAFQGAVGAALLILIIGWLLRWMT